MKKNNNEITEVLDSINYIIDSFLECPLISLETKKLIVEIITSQEQIKI